MHDTWYVIINPASGNGRGIKRLNKLKVLFNLYNISFTLQLTKYAHHEKLLVQEAINKGFTKYISVGGDGTLHHIVNAIMTQEIIPIHKIQVAVIPVGTGNDWVKNYKIPTNFKKAVICISKANITFQDIGKIKFSNKDKTVYFNNVAGIGFDAFAIDKINNLKYLGPLAYLIGAIQSFLNYKSGKVKFMLNNKTFSSNLFLLAIGICKYSGAGMQLTNYKQHKNGFFDITYIEKLRLSKILLHIPKLYNGKLKKLSEVKSYQGNHLKIDIDKNYPINIQADGEFLGTDDIEISIINNAIQFITP